jgi:hypothetical protein
MHTQDHKQQLHERILERRDQLTTARARDPSGTSEHARAIDEALSQLAMHLSGKWDEVDDVEAAQLSGWLESTRFLVGARGPVVESPAPAELPPEEAATVEVSS